MAKFSSITFLLLTDLYNSLCDNLATSRANHRIKSGCFVSVSRRPSIVAYWYVFIFSYCVRSFLVVFEGHGWMLISSPLVTNSTFVFLMRGEEMRNASLIRYNAFTSLSLTGPLVLMYTLMALPF